MQINGNCEPNIFGGSNAGEIHGEIHPIGFESVKHHLNKKSQGLERSTLQMH